MTSRRKKDPLPDPLAAGEGEQPTEGGRYIRDPATGCLTKLPPGAEQQRALDALNTDTEA